MEVIFSPLVLQRYMTPWWARLAAAESDQKDAHKQMERASQIEEADNPDELAGNLAEGGSWYLEGIDFLQKMTPDGGEQNIRRIREQLADLNSDK